MERKQVKEILSKQLQLLAEVSKKSQPEHLPELTLAMCQVADCLKEEYVTVSQKGMTDSGDKKRISDVIRRVLHDDKALERELVVLLGEDELKSIGEQIADVVRTHDLQQSPDVCRKLFRHMSDVIDGWKGACDLI